MKRIKTASCIFALSICVLIFGNANAQLVVSGEFDTTTTGVTNLINQFVGNGIGNVSNISIGFLHADSGVSANAGYFSEGSTLIGFDEGIVLSTGNALNVQGQNSSDSSSTDWGETGSDANLNSLTGGTVYDPIKIEFDFTPDADLVRFEYVFASEEYNENVGSNQNDVFGFFISGPGIMGTRNMALIPGSSDTVSINNINNGSYSQFFNDNTTGAVNIQCDGFTDVFTASTYVQACASYHIKIIIGDVGNHNRDSWIFLKAGSFSSPTVIGYQVEFPNPLVDSTLIEGCVDASLVINLNLPAPGNRPVPITVGGTATYGTDYTLSSVGVITGTPPNFVAYFWTGQTSCDITIHAINDGISEAPETITFQIQSNFCPPYQYFYDSITISDRPELDIAVSSDTFMCVGSSVPLNVSVSGDTSSLVYEWTPSSGLSQTNVSNPIASPDQTTTYTVVATNTDNCASSSETVTVVVQNAFDGEQICLVTVDTLTQKNKIVWNKTPNVGTFSYNIYKEVATNIYNFIGSVAFGSPASFIDSTSVPQTHADKYKISVVDTCDSESAKSPYHKTINLVLSMFGTTAGLTWTEYEDENGVFVPLQYYIFKGNQESNMSIFDSISGSFTNYNDNNVTELYYYAVAVRREPSCDGNKSITSYSFSNIRNNGLVGVNENLQNDILQIYPNPFTEQSVVELPDPINGPYLITITDIAGKIIQRGSVNGSTYVIERGTLERGFYNIELKNENRIFRGKIIVE
ncbi:MAG: choice-of-anchor L domain-containing protein [Bacteroidetes bacterium]|nr:choice-of-anchor L domain-containing protein [Bacteroidota bacterium]MBU1717874.1 choice-of-anchor L domain-containing protein [Bacteroidota bacterium]